MDKNDLLPDVVNQVTVQDYSKKPVIDGVKFIDLNLFPDDGGHFSELMRLNDGVMEGMDGFQVRQINNSMMEPGVIKAFHLHFNQSEFWYVPPAGKLLVGLYDVRKDSPTAGVKMRLVGGSHKARLLYIPAGVAHGAANVTAERQQLFYFTDQHFNLEQPDENRLPWDILGADFWALERG